MSKSQIPPKTSRLAISKSELDSDHGRKLAKVLKQVLADGEITPNEIVALRKWLVEAGKVSNIAGINFLREEIESVLADGEIEQSEADLLVQSILRVTAVARPWATSVRFHKIESPKHVAPLFEEWAFCW